MPETWKDRIFGGVITLIVTVIGAILLNWWNSPGDQNGIILVTDKQIEERTQAVNPETKEIAQLQRFVWEYQFNNIKGDLTNFSILIPVKSLDNAPIMVEAEPSRAILKSVSGFAEIQSLGHVKITFQSIEKGGSVLVRFKSPSDMVDPKLDGPASDVKKFAF